MTFRAPANVRQEALQPQNPYLEIPENRWQLFGPLCDSLQARLKHSEQPVVALMRRRKLDYKVSHVSEPRKRFGVSRKIKVRLHNFHLPQRDEFLVLFLIVRDVEQGEGFERSTESVLNSSGPARYSSDQSRVTSQAYNYLVRFCEIVGS